jgi:hypothetical protein
MEQIFELLERYGLSVVLLIGCLYALYKFFFFSIIEVKNEFSKRHELMANKMDEVKNELQNVREKLNTILESIRGIKR